MKPKKGLKEVNLLKWTVVLYATIFVMKFVVYLYSGVMALLAEALHTLSDVIISVFLLAAIVVSRKEADRQHRYGHGRAQNIAAVVAATLFISFTSFRLYEEAIPKLIWHEHRTYTNMNLVFAVLIVSMVIAAMPLIGLLRQKMKGAAAKAQYLELINDELGLLAALIGSIFILEGHPLADPLATIVVATIIAINAIGVFRENISFLMGYSPGPEYLAKVRKVAHSVEGIRGVHALRAEYIGPDMIRLTMHLEVPRGITVEAADNIGEAVRRKIYKELKVRYCFVHVDPEGTHDRDVPACIENDENGKD
jgi:cation diffusion facilitator family transporter